jgi:LmbE family N-acetylglucosaminyl deacetylase
LISAPSSFVSSILTPTEMSKRNDRDVVVFLFAHQDDEMGVFHHIEHVRQQGMRPVCLYLTDGVHRGVRSERRCRESLYALGRLGVPPDDIHFVGTDAGIPDGGLLQHVLRAEREVASRLERLGPIHSFVSLAYEGGHMDHDAVFAIAAKLASEAGCLAQSRQFSLYRSSLGGFVPYILLQPVAQNGQVFEEPIPVSRRWAYLGLCLSYRSQKKAMLGLLPFIALDYLLSGRQKLQSIDIRALERRPHEGALLYETRGRGSYRDYANAISGFLSARRGDAPGPGTGVAMSQK